MNIKLDFYKIFYAVASQMSFSKGAESLYMTQSAASQSIKNLENALDTKLFLRGKKGISLTPEGELLYEYVEKALSLLEKGEHEIEKMKKGELGSLRIGVSDTLSRYLLLPFLEKFSSIYPMINLQIVNRTSVQAIELLKQGKVDLAFVNLPLSDDAVNIMPYLEVQDIFVAGERFGFLKEKTLSLEEISEYPLILLERNSNSRHYLDKFFFSRGIQLKPEIELGSHDLVLEFVKSNLGIACVTREFASQYLEDGALFAISTSEPIPPRHIGICTLKGVSLTPSGKTFISLVEKYPADNEYSAFQAASHISDQFPQNP